MKKILVRQKHLLCLFSKCFWVCLFPTNLAEIFFKRWFLRLKTCILVENRQTNFFYKKMKSLNTIDVFSSPKWNNISQNDNFLWVWTREVKLGKTPNFQFWPQNFGILWKFQILVKINFFLGSKLNSIYLYEFLW